MTKTYYLIAIEYQRVCPFRYDLPDWLKSKDIGVTRYLHYHQSHLFHQSHLMDVPQNIQLLLKSDSLSCGCSRDIPPFVWTFMAKEILMTKLILIIYMIICLRR